MESSVRLPAVVVWKIQMEGGLDVASAKMAGSDFLSALEMIEIYYLGFEFGGWR